MWSARWRCWYPPRPGLTVWRTADSPHLSLCLRPSVCVDTAEEGTTVATAATGASETGAAGARGTTTGESTSAPTNHHRVLLRGVFTRPAAGQFVPSPSRVLLLPPNRLRPSFFAIFFKRLNENPRNFRSEHLRTCPNFHYLDILLSHKYFRYFPLSRNVKVNLGPDGG